MDVSLRVGDSVLESFVEASGSSSSYVGDWINLGNFGNLIDNTINIWVIYLFKGRVPNYVYFFSWGSLNYNNFGWEECYYTTRIQNAKYIDVKSMPNILSPAEMRNDSNKTATFKTTLSHTVEHTVETSWSHSTGFSVSGGTKISIDIVKGSMKMTVSSTWGREDKVSETEQITSGGEISVELKPGQAVQAQMIMYETKATVEVEYETKLHGLIVADYNPPFEGHHYYAWSIEYFMLIRQKYFSSPQNSFITTEKIQMKSYAKKKLRVIDHETGAEVLFRELINDAVNLTEEYEGI